MHTLPPINEVIKAFMAGDSSYEGIFYVAVKTTRIFCRPTCKARKPLLKNVEFFAAKSEALHAGYRPCLRCKPMNTVAEVPSLVEQLRVLVESDPTGRVRERNLLDMGIDPSTARRQFQRYFGMSFHAYQRARRMGSALATVRKGSKVLDTQLDHGFESASGFREAFAKVFGTPPSKASGVHCLLAKWLDSPLGPMLAIADDRGLHIVDWVDRRGLERAIERLRTDFDKPLRIETLARELGMSPSGFHEHFKAVTAMSPLQFQKQLRLQEARRLLLVEDVDAATAGYRVGYEDATQFKKEYKRFFGEPPMRDVERLRAATPVGMTCSAGIACWDGDESTTELVGRADAALFEAKREGRSRTVTASK